ncbi:BUD13 homolog isoform X1 [Ornithorhynchus anatinus]|uniref:BUD13 homolog n=1 Tax=Ornithorhynchus anatinus TaxID=9258 RepID=A0A6I8NH92_ORNAN|nr:BUD13 homolog isoform X1 [Ornithorhynchus anatinus]
MAAAPPLSKAEYLKRYLSGAEAEAAGQRGPEAGRKRRRKKLKPGLGGGGGGRGMRIVDDDVGWDHISPRAEDGGGGGGDDDDDGDPPVVAEFVDERPEEVKWMEEFRTSNKWRLLGDENEDPQDPEIFPAVPRPGSWETSKQMKSKKSSDRSRHDSPDASPPRRARHDSPDASPPRRARHDSPDASPPRRARHDSPDASPPRRARHDSPDASPPRRARHDSPDASPPRRARHDSPDASPPRRARHDSPDASPPRRARHDSPDASPPRRARHDSPDASPPRRARHDSPDASPPRRARHDSPDLSPPRRARHDSDLSPPRRARHDSPVQSSTRTKSSKSLDRHSTKTSLSRKDHRHRERTPPRTSGLGSGFDPSLLRKKRTESPPKEQKPQRGPKGCSPVRREHPSNPSPTRRRRHDSDSPPSRRGSRRPPDPDLSPPRIGRGRASGPRGSDSDLSPPRRRRRAGSSDSDPSPPRRGPSGAKKAQMLSGAKAGLKSADAVRKEQQELRKSDRDTGQLEAESQNAETVFRDRLGHKRDLKLERLERRRQAEEQSEKDEQYAQWGKGLAQSRQQEQNVQDAMKEMQKPLARYIDDEDLDQMLREQEREGDPMADFIKKKAAKENKGKKTKPRYSGPAPPLNRFNIWPGYRWDGVDRSNGFEQKRFARLASKKAVEELAYKWSVEDM